MKTEIVTAVPSTRRRFGNQGVVLALAVALALPFASESEAAWVVTLRSGALLESRYQPKEASWDKSKVLILSDVGNWISVDRSSISTVVNSQDAKGFGRSIDTTTVELGPAPNDGLSPEQIQQILKEGGAGALALMGGGPGGQQQQQTPAPYSIQQFVEPGATQGIPIFGSGNPAGAGTSPFSQTWPQGFLSTTPLPAPASTGGGGTQQQQ